MASLKDHYGDKEFMELVRAPFIAWPTVILFFITMSGLAIISYIALTGGVSLWLAALLNGFVVYFLFSAIHDSSHFAISKVKWFNNVFGHVGILFFGPLATLDLARWIHNQHHRNTNDVERDPDHFGHIIDIWTPLRWMNFDYFYTKFFLQQAGVIRKRFIKGLLFQIAFVIGAVSAAAYFGYFAEIVMLWLVPTRISSALFVMMFVYLPHAPFMATSRENEYKATNIRAGWEWLLTPLMTFQNYHLVHHLYPTAPFYRLIKIWNRKLDYHLEKDPYFVGTFSIGRPDSKSLK